MRRFYGIRPHPPEEYTIKKLTNGPHAPDYAGVIMDNGRVVLLWLTGYNSMTIYDSWEDFMHITGHPEYGTILRFLDSEEQVNTL